MADGAGKDGEGTSAITTCKSGGIVCECVSERKRKRKEQNIRQLHGKRRKKNAGRGKGWNEGGALTGPASKAVGPKLPRVGTKLDKQPGPT